MAKPWETLTVPSLGGAVSGAMAGRSPGNPGTMYINGKPVTQEQWQRGDLLATLTSPQYAAGAGFPNARIPVPYQPPIPSGWYDPNLDASRQGASRGLLNTEQDIGLAGRRSGEDLGYEQGQLKTQAGDATWDLTRSHDRSLEDIGTASRYEGQDYATNTGYENQDYATNTGYENVDYGRNVAMLTRQYGQQGRQQAEQARRYGVSSGGIALLSAAKRAENQALDRQGLDTAHERTTAGLNTAHDRAISGLYTAHTRAGEGFATGTRRTNQDFESSNFRIGRDLDSALGRAGTLYDRGVADRGTALGRAQTEDLFYGLDTEEQKKFQALQAGWGR